MIQSKTKFNFGDEEEEEVKKEEPKPEIKSVQI